MDFDDIALTTIDGEPTSLGAYPGVRLIVNVASQCGHTPQYAGLERLHRRYADRGLAVLGFPSNQFLQERGSEADIKSFCTTTYSVTFPLFAKTRVNGRHAHLLFAELQRHPDAAGEAGRVRWNFEKFLVLPDAQVRRFRSKVEPESPEITAAVEAALASTSPDGQ